MALDFKEVEAVDELGVGWCVCVCVCEWGEGGGGEGGIWACVCFSAFTKD